MENLSTQAKNDLPFELYEDEEVKLTQANLKVTIKYNKSDEYELTNGALALTTNRVIFFTTSPKKLFYFNYQNAISFGKSKLNLIVLLSDLEEKPWGEEEDDEEMEEEEQDDIIEKLKRVEDFDEMNHVNLVGNYEVTFDFSNTGLGDLDGVLEKFNYCSSLNPDENAEEVVGGDDFITADDIDDSGNVIFNRNDLANENDSEEADGDEEDEDDNDMEVEKPNGQQNGNQHDKDKIEEEH